MKKLFYLLKFFNPHPRICLLICGEGEREEGREDERKEERKQGTETERKGDRETLMQEKNVDGLPLVYTPTRHQTHSLGMCPEWGLNSQVSINFW